MPHRSRSAIHAHHPRESAWAQAHPTRLCHSDRSDAERRNLAANEVHARSLARCFDFAQHDKCAIAPLPLGNCLPAQPAASCLPVSRPSCPRVPRASRPCIPPSRHHPRKPNRHPAILPPPETIANCVRRPQNSLSEHSGDALPVFTDPLGGFSGTASLLCFRNEYGVPRFAQALRVPSAAGGPGFVCDPL